MYRMVRLSGALALALFLAACHLISDEPLLPTSEGHKPFGDELFAIQQSSPGIFTISDKSTLSALQGRFSDNRYVLDDTSWISFHKYDESAFDYLAQYVIGPKTTYYGIRIEAKEVRASNISLNTDDLAAMAAGGVTPLEVGGDRKVTTRLALDLAVKTWAKRRHDELLQSSGYVATFSYARDPAGKEALMIEALTQICLALAGNPYDPVVQAMPTPYKWGVEMADINAPVAIERCAWAKDTDQAPPSAQLALARAYVVSGDYGAASAVIEKLMAREFELAFVLKADMMMRGQGEAADPTGARRMLAERAERSPMAAVGLGYMYATDPTGGIDYVEARRYFELGTRGDISLAYYGLADLYAKGQGVDEDLPRALRLFETASEKGNRHAAYRAGNMHYFGQGTESSYDKAFPLMKSAAERGLADAQYVLGFMHAYGQGTTKSEKTGVEWLKKASDKGSMSAKAELGRMTYLGLGTEADKDAGLALLREASAAGDTRADEYIAEVTGSAGGAQLPAIDSDLPPDVRQSVQKLAAGEPFELNSVNLPFMGGIAQYLTETCGLPANMSDRMELAGLALNGASFALGGNDYSNPDLGAAMGNLVGQSALFSAGTLFARQVECKSGLAKSMADGLVEASRSNKSDGDGGPSTFVKTCTPVYSETRCNCLAQLARGAIPDIHQRHYHRDIIAELIQRNPILALTMSLSCGIVEY